MAKAKSKKRPSNHYSDDVKAAIINATRAARSAGKPWVDAFQAARKAGYRGTLAGIERMLRVERDSKGGKRKKAGRPAKKSAKVGRPAGKSAAVTSTRLTPVLARAAKELRKIAALLDKAR